MKKIFIILIILAVVAGGFFYAWYVWIPNQIAKENPSQVSTTTPPTLFSKGDYKIEERADGKYILVPKVGLTAKVPDGWKIEKMKTSEYPEPKYWVNLLSPDAEVKDILIKGCGISIVAGNNTEDNKRFRHAIQVLQQHPKTPPEEIEEIPNIYQDLTVIEISHYKTLQWITPDKPVLGQTTGVEIPIEKEKLVSMETRFPPGYKNKCFPIWKNFLRNTKVD